MPRSKQARWLSLVGVSTILCGLAATSFAQTSVTVRTASELMNAVSSANSAGGNRIINVADGTYTLTDTLYINAPNITVQGESAKREAVIIQGDAMSSSARVGNIFRVAGSNFKLQDVTLQRAGWHTIQIVGNENADAPTIRNCVLRDAYQQLMKVTNDPGNPTVVSDNGLVENCLFEYTAGIGPQYYIGGIDAHSARNWTVRNNVFRNIASPNTSVAEFAIHFWDKSSNIVVERNQIVDCDRGIGFGMINQGNDAGIIRNNMIYHSANGDPFADAGIALADSPNSQVYNNTIYQEHGFQWALEYRFAATSNVLIVNNLTNKPLMARDGASGTTGNNVVNAASSLFTQVSSGNLHLVKASSGVTDSGRTVSGLTNDFDGNSRPQGAGIDIGADELGGTQQVAPLPPTNVQTN
jgi:hypothetical protein